MEWLNDLLGVEAPPGTVLRSAELGFRGQFPWALAVLLILVLTGASFALYFTEKAKIGPVRRTLLATLRSLALALLVLLLLRPLLYSEFEGEKPRPVFVLLDNSQSMKQQDRRISSEDKLRVAIAQGKMPAQTKLKADTPLPQGMKDFKEIKDVSRADLVRAVLENPQLDLLTRLGKHGAVRTYFFGTGLKGTQKGADKGGP